MVSCPDSEKKHAGERERGRQNIQQKGNDSDVWDVIMFGLQLELFRNVQIQPNVNVE